MRSRIKKVDPKTLAIWILSAILAIETLILFSQHPRKTTIIKEKKARVISKRELPKGQMAGRIAIIVDDCGYNLQPCEIISKIKRPVTFSVLPALKYSTAVAQCAHYSEKEVMLHLPMEPHQNSDKYPDGYIIKTTMSNKKIERLIKDALATVPFAAGVNNHMGSKATEDTKTMKNVFSVLKADNLFFIDSMVTNRSVAQDLASAMGIPFAERNIFLDNNNDRSYIEGQFLQLAEIARAKGYAVGIGHARALTLQIIKEQTEQIGRAH